MRIHKGDGVPVKNKPYDIEKLGRGKRPIDTIADLYPRNEITKEEYNEKRQAVKTTDGLDPVDSIYQTFKKYKDKNDKIEEMRNYFANNCSNIPFSPNFPHDIFNHDKPESVPPYQRRSEFESAFMPSAFMPSASSTSQIDKVPPKKVVGYLGYNCNYCLEFEALQVMYDPSANDKISCTRHTCDPGTLNSAMAYPKHAREDIWMYRTLNLPKQMIKAVKEWTNGEVFLISEKLTSSEVLESTITLDLRKNEYSWLTRAIVQKCTILNDKELKKFFTLIVEWCATFCCLCINFVEKEGQQNVKQEYYCFCLSYKPRLPWEAR
jgi:hypothetical protein